MKLYDCYEKPENNYNVNALGIIATNRDNFGFNSHRASGVMNNAPGFSAHSSPQVHQRRRQRELPEASKQYYYLLQNNMQFLDLYPDDSFSVCLE